MRPAGEISLALLKAAGELCTPERAPTVRELAHHAQVGEKAAVSTVKDLKRAGKLRIATDKDGNPRKRRVEHCRKPVAEYEPAPDLLDPDSRHGHGWVQLDRCVAGWAR